MDSNLLNEMASLSLDRRNGVNDDDDDQEKEVNANFSKHLLMSLIKASQLNQNHDDNDEESDDDYDDYDDYDDDDDYDDYDDDDDNDEDGMGSLSKTKQFKKLQKISSIYFKVQNIKKNPSRFLIKYFDSLKSNINCSAQKAISIARKQGNSGKKVKKIKTKQSEMLSQINKVEQECTSKLKKNLESVSSLACQLFELLESAPKKNAEKKQGMDDLVCELSDVRKSFNKLMCQLFVGHKICYEQSSGQEAEKKLGQLNLSCCYDYKILSPVDGTQVPIEKEQAELIYYYESIMKKRLEKIYNSSRLMYIFTKFSEPKDVVEIIKLLNLLCVPKPTEFDLSCIRKRFDKMNEIQEIPREEYFKEKSSRDKRIQVRTVVVEFCMGLVNKKFNLENEQERMQIYKDLTLILFSWRTIGVRMRRHVLHIAKSCCDWLSKLEVQKLEDKITEAECENELDHDYDTDEEMQYLFEDRSSESDNSNYDSEHTVHSDYE